MLGLTGGAGKCPKGLAEEFALGGGAICWLECLMSLKECMGGFSEYDGGLDWLDDSVKSPIRDPDMPSF